MSKIAKEHAEREVMAFLKANDIEVHEELESQKDIVVQAMVDGRLTIIDGQLSYKLKKDVAGVTDLKFREYTAETLMAAGKDKDDPIKGLFRVVSQLTGHDFNVIKKLGKKDTALVIAVGSLFLA